MSTCHLSKNKDNLFNVLRHTQGWLFPLRMLRIGQANSPFCEDPPWLTGMSSMKTRQLLRPKKGTRLSGSRSLK